MAGHSVTLAHRYRFSLATRGRCLSPVQHPIVAAPPNAEQTFSTLLKRDGFFVGQPDQAADQAQASCAYLAQGGTGSGLIDTTAAKSPGATRQQDTQVTRDGVDAYSPQYEKK